MAAKTIILGEMAVLYLGSLVREYQTTGGESWTLGILSNSVLKKAIAVAGLLALLTFLADIGLGTAAAVFGGLIVLGYVLSFGGTFGQSIVDLEKTVFES